MNMFFGRCLNETDAFTHTAPKLVLCAVICLISLDSVAQTKQASWRKLGLISQPPTESAEIFGSGRFTTSMTEHVSPTFSADGKHVIWSVWMPQGASVIGMNYLNRNWGVSNLVLLEGHPEFDGATFNPDGDRVYFASKARAEVRSTLDPNWNIWYSDFDQDGDWSRPVKLPSEVNTTENEVFPTVASSGNVYFTVLGDTKEYYRSLSVDGALQPRELLPEWINNGAHYSNIYVDPEERFLIFSSDRPSGFGDGDLYVSFSDEDGSWKEPINLGPKVNSDRLDRFPAITPDGKALIFARHTKQAVGYGDGDYYWIGAEIVTALAHQAKNELN